VRGRRAVVLADEADARNGDATRSLAAPGLAYAAAVHGSLWRAALSVGALAPRWADWVLAGVLWRWALRGEHIEVVAFARAQATALPEPERAFWAAPEVYTQLLDECLLAPLHQAAAAGPVPNWLQRAALCRLAPYFTVDARERAPTVHVSGELADAFYERVHTVLQHVDEAEFGHLAALSVESHAIHALRACQPGGHVSPVWVDAHDAAHGWACVKYWCIGDKPAESWTIDGAASQPTHAKYRGCRYFGRLLFRQRIAWVGARSSRCIALSLDDAPASLSRRKPPLDLAGPVCAADLGASLLRLDRLAHDFPPARRAGRVVRRSGLRGLKAQLLIWCSQLPGIRHYFRDAWAISDRDVDADDSGEHFYRWLVKHHPEVNAWYMLTRNSADWARLKSEGVRLMPPGFWRKCMLLNAKHVVASHTHHAEAGFNAELYGDRMRWRFTFLQHGVIYNDLSHWLNTQAIDCFVTSGAEEHCGIVGDDSPYRFTSRETLCAGLPRHDALIRLNAITPKSARKLLLFMPTWRGSLFDERACEVSAEERLAIFARSELASNWRQVFGDPRLVALAQAQGLQLAFFAHTNLIPMLRALELPVEFMVYKPGVDRFQPIFARTAAFVTDYTSVAFELALIRRPVFYYQPDRARFYGGDHNWRPGYFDYDRDGFGPVAFNADELITQLAHFADSGCQLEPDYLTRMRRALPDADEDSSPLVYQAIRRMEGADLG